MSDGFDMTNDFFQFSCQLQPFLCFKIVQTCVKPGVLLKSRSLFGRLDADFTGQCLELEENLGNLEIRKRSLCLRLSVGCLLDSFICDKTLLEASPILGFITHQTKLLLVRIANLKDKHHRTEMIFRSKNKQSIYCNSNP